ncbi:MAG: hypothetical protein JM58_15910 [Peptococcaceae bacterium BICA1-8]|nr:MAG: hypothetical protein JM58_15910 [Peptococcaceae bacterium BICA1-8]
MKVFILILTFSGIAFIQVPVLIKKRQWGELTVIFILLAIGFTLSLLQTIGVKVPDPNKGIEFLIKQIHP